MTDYELVTEITVNGEIGIRSDFLSGKPSKITLTLRTVTQNAPTVTVLGTKEILIP